MLSVRNVEAGYAGIRAVRDVTLSVRQGETVALIGSNGAGKSTLINTICGVVKATRGAIEFAGDDIARWPAHRIARAGVLQVPEGRRILGPLSVRENLELGSLAARGRNERPAGIEEVYAMFPVLREREAQAGGSLSGGQQQMLAIGRALMGAPRILLLDEPSLGLAPIMVQQVFAALDALHARGLTILLVEQNARLALAHSDRAYVMERGAIVQEGESRLLAEDAGVQAHYLGS